MNQMHAGHAKFSHDQFPTNQFTDDKILTYLLRNQVPRSIHLYQLNF